MVTALKGHLFADEFQDTFSQIRDTVMKCILSFSLSFMASELSLCDESTSERMSFLHGAFREIVLSRMERIFIYKYSLTCFAMILFFK